MNILINLLT